MFNSRRRRLAWLFALVLLAELAIFCCASTHLSTHLCPGCERCAICACVRASRNRAAVAPPLALALLALVTLRRTAQTRRVRAIGHSLFALHVQLND